MTHLFFRAMGWAALSALPLILIALVIGRINASAKLKVWACRIAFLQLPLGLIPVGISVKTVSET